MTSTFIHELHKRIHTSKLKWWAGKLIKSLQRYLENPPGWWNTAYWGDLEPNVPGGPSCSLPALRFVGHIPLPQTRDKKEAHGGLSDTSPNLSHISVLRGLRRRVSGGNGCFQAACWEMKGQQGSTSSSLAKTKVSCAPFWCGLHFTRNVAAAGPKEQRALDVRARKHESWWLAMLLLHPGCYPEKLKFLSPLGLVVRWMAKPQSLQEK